MHGSTSNVYIRMFKLCDTWGWCDVLHFMRRRKSGGENGFCGEAFSNWNRESPALRSVRRGADFGSLLRHMRVGASTHPRATCLADSPFMLGHEIAGTVVAAGRAVEGIAVGENVTVMPQVGCGHCVYCQAGATNLCQDKIVPGTPRWNGAFGEYFNAPARVVVPIGAVSCRPARLIEPLSRRQMFVPQPEGALRR